MIFALLTLLSALSLASVAGWFSIVGFMAIYAGAPFYALLMGVVTECAKLVTTSWLYRNWGDASWKIKIPLLYFTLALMIATSIGVFGFLSKAHLDQGADTIDNSSKIERLTYQINREKSIISDNEKVIEQMDATVNSFLGKERTDRSLSVRKSQAPQRKQLRDDIDASQRRIDGFSEEKFKLESEVRKVQLDVGPIRYIAELFYGATDDTGKNIETAVRIFTLLLVSTLDPLAIILLTAANHTLLRLKNEKNENFKKEKGDDTHFKFDVESENKQAGVKDEEEVEQKNYTMATSIDGQEHINGREEDTKVYKETPEAPGDTKCLDDEFDVSGHSYLYKPYAHFKHTMPPIVYTGVSNDTLVEKEEIAETEEKVMIGNLTLSELLSEQLTPPTASIKQPEHTQLFKEDIQEDEPHTNQPWAQQEHVLREILGSGQHFIPKKIQEKNTDITLPIVQVNNVNKYPKVAGWLSEFKKVNNE